MQPTELSDEERLALEAFRSPATHSVTVWAALGAERFRMEIVRGPADPGEYRFHWNVWHADNWHVPPNYTCYDRKAYVSPEEALQDCLRCLADESADDPLIPRRHPWRALFEDRGSL